MLGRGGGGGGGSFLILFCPRLKITIGFEPIRTLEKSVYVFSVQCILEANFVYDVNKIGVN